MDTHENGNQEQRTPRMDVLFCSYLVIYGAASPLECYERVFPFVGDGLLAEER